MELKMKLLCVLWSVFCVTECVRRNELRRQRRQSCPDGTYKTSNGLECCLCSKGRYLKSDCTSHLTAPTCDACEPETYLDHPNYQKNCEVCKKCGNNDNMMVKQACTSSSNTVCHCKEDHFCDKGDECKVCYNCETCEFGIKVPCSPTNDTQCNEKPTTDVAAIVIAVVVVLIVVAAAAAVFCLWKRKRLCFKPPETSRNPESVPMLDDPELEKFLYRIGEILGFKVVRIVVRRQGVLAQTTIDNIMDENPRDADERAYQLLNAWYQKHGMKGAYKSLCENLTAINMRSKVDQVEKLIRDDLSKEVKQNGAMETNGAMEGNEEVEGNTAVEL